MLKSVVGFLFVCFLLWQTPVLAENLIFPTTEKEIVEALSLKNGKTVFEGVEYQSQNGRVYKVIGGKRYRIRGLGGIVESGLVPRVGALVYFDVNASNIKQESYSLLDEFGKAMQGGLSGATIIIAGHTDSIGTRKYNQKLSEDRAVAVAKYLIGHYEITSERLQVKGFGEEKPIAINKSEEGRHKNRRVEFIRAE